MKLKNFIIIAIFSSLFVGQDCFSGSCCGKETSSDKEKSKTVTSKKKKISEIQPLLQNDNDINTSSNDYQTIISSNISSHSFQILLFEEFEQLKSQLPESTIVIWERNIKQIIIPSFGGFYVFSDLITAQSKNVHVKDLKINPNSIWSKDKLPSIFKAVSKDMKNKNNKEGKPFEEFIEKK